MTDPHRLVRRHHAAVAAGALLGEVAVVLYRGPGAALIRGALGDLLVIVLLVHLVAVVHPGHRRWRLAAVAGLAVGLELLQALQLTAAPGTVTAFVLGRTFDPLDLVAYAVGGVLAWSLEPRVTGSPTAA